MIQGIMKSVLVLRVVTKLNLPRNPVKERIQRYWAKSGKLVIVSYHSGYWDLRLVV